MSVKENDVLIAAAGWLLKRKIWPYHCSVAGGKGIDYSSEKERVINFLRPFQKVFKEPPEKFPSFSKHGPDILGLDLRSSLKDAKEQEICPENFEWWQIECKGSGDGKQSTQRNNFDRGVASVVSYYGPSPTEFRNFKPHLGFALPNTEYFKDLLKTRLKRPLRTRLDLWVLVYDSDDKSVHAVPPDAEYT